MFYYKTCVITALWFVNSVSFFGLSLSKKDTSCNESFKQSWDDYTTLLMCAWRILRQFP